MKRKFLVLLFYFISFLLLFSLTACESDTFTASDVENISGNNEKEIVYITGHLGSNKALEIVFSENQVEEEVLQIPLKNDGILTFDPPLEGSLYWENANTLFFKPEEPVAANTEYFNVLDLQKLFPAVEDVTPLEKKFTFQTTGNYVVDYESNFDYQKEGQEIYFEANLKFNRNIDKQLVEEAVSLSHIEGEGENNYRLEVETVDGKNYSLISEALKRGSEEKQLAFKISNEPLQLENDYNREYAFSAAGELGIDRIEEVKDGDYSDLRVFFSEPLASNQDYSPYVNIEPFMDIDITTEGRKMIISGDFQPGQKYKLTFLAGLRSAVDKAFRTDQEYQIEVEITDIMPEIEFSDGGNYLTSGREEKITFRTMNLRRAQVTVLEMEPPSLVDFMKENYSDGYNIQRFGEVVDKQILDIGEHKNRWIKSELDLSGLEIGEAGQYVLLMDFDAEDALYFPGDWSSWRVNRYIRNEAAINKKLIISDLGITTKETPDDKFHVYVSNIMQAKPVDEARVRLKCNKGLVVDFDSTNDQGRTVLSAEEIRSIRNRRPTYIEVDRGAQKSVLRLSGARLDYSLFDTGGLEAESGLKAFIYTDRGVYRPGEEINVSVIARDRNDTFPDGQQVKLTFYDPRNNVIEEKKGRGQDGFYSFNLSTDRNALTGDWLAEVKVAGETFTEIVNIEEVVPHRIEVDIKPHKEELTLEDSVDYTLKADYLFGQPGSELESKSEIIIEPYDITFDSYNNFIFTDQTNIMEPLESNKIKKNLDKEGKADVSWKIPNIDTIPSTLRAVINSRVIQSSGRPVLDQEVIPINVYDRYVGIQKLNRNSISMGTRVDFDVILCDDKGEPVKGEELKYNFYRMRKYWWWHYGNHDEFRQHYKQDEETELVSSGTMNTDEHGLASFAYNLDDYGQMLLEVKDPEGGHTAAYFFRSHWWGGIEEGDFDVIDVRSDKESYYPGDTAEIKMGTPESGLILLTVEKGGEILTEEWHEIGGEYTEISLPIIEEYVPNVYIYASVLQPYGEQDNELPLRSYGILPLEVNRENSKLDYELEVPEEIYPGEKFDVEISSKPGAQFTVAIVDEGLLNITNFITPDPYEYFYAKEYLDIMTYDLFSDVIGLTEGYVYNTFSIGGAISESRAVVDEPENYREEQADSGEDDSQRFEPVAMFSGPKSTDENGKLNLSFEMPNYNGRVRVMAVGAKKAAYGSQEKDMYVRAPLMILPSLPRVLAPEDEIIIPVTVFYTEEKEAEVEVKLESGDLLEVKDNRRTLRFKEPGEKEVYFSATAMDAVGNVEVGITARGDEYKTSEIKNIRVRSTSPYTYLAEDKFADPGEEIVHQVPNEGITDTGWAGLTVSRRKNLNINHRVDWLVRYPFRSLGSITSRTLAQLYLEDHYDFEPEKLKELDKKINSGIDELRKYQISSGGFSYWPYRDSENYWITNFTGHLMLKAKERGYRIPQQMMNNWLDFQGEKGRQFAGCLLTQSYRLYLLSLAGEPEISALNYLRENHLDELCSTGGFYVAGAYELAGYKEQSEKLMDTFDTEVKEEVSSGPYGSSLRNKAIMLEVLIAVGRDARALELYNTLATHLSSSRWLSTQETGYMLMAVSEFINQMDKSDKKLAGLVKFPDGNEKEFETDNDTITFEVIDYFGEEVTLTNKSEIPFYGTLEWEGIPGIDSLEPEQSDLSLRVFWTNDQGEVIEPDEFDQGESFWGRFRVENKADYKLEDVALMQLLPSGWEIENIRLLDTELPDWTDNLNLEREKFMDLRDDRIMWFFDIRRGATYDFVIKVNAVTPGRFYLPPAQVETMYDNDYRTVLEGKEVEVIHHE